MEEVPALRHVYGSIYNISCFVGDADIPVYAILYKTRCKMILNTPTWHLRRVKRASKWVLLSRTQIPELRQSGIHTDTAHQE